jgi:hypothetical protein
VPRLTENQARPVALIEIYAPSVSVSAGFSRSEPEARAVKCRRCAPLARGRGETVAPDSRLRFGEAADLWLAGPVQDLRPTTQAGYRTGVEQHLRRRYGYRRLDGITADDLAAPVRDLRQHGKSEATIAAVLGAVGRIYKSLPVASASAA